MARAKIEPTFRKRSGAAERHDAPLRPLSAKKPKRRRSWPYAIALLCAWAIMIGAGLIFHLESELPDASHLMLQSPSHDITILDRSGRLIARKGLT